MIIHLPWAVHQSFVDSSEKLYTVLEFQSFIAVFYARQASVQRQVQRQYKNGQWKMYCMFSSSSPGGICLEFTQQIYLCSSAIHICIYAENLQEMPSNSWHLINWTCLLTCRDGKPHLAPEKSSLGRCIKSFQYNNCKTFLNHKSCPSLSVGIQLTDEALF